MEAEARYRDERNAADYNEDRFGGAFGDWLRHSEVRAYRSLLSGRPSSLLDVGAGTGKLSLALADDAERVTCSDFAAPMLAVAKDDAEQAGLPVRFVVTDAMNLAFRGSSFDTVVSSRMLMHVPEWRRALAELLRVARSTVLFDFPPTTSFAVVDVILKRVRRALGSDAWTHRTLRISDVQREVERHGWRVVVIRKDWFLPVALHRKLDDPALTERLENFCGRLGLRRLFGAPVTFKAVPVPAPKPARVAPRREPEPQEVQA